MKLLTKDEYEATFSPPMVNVSDTAEEIVNLREYADPIIEADYHNCSACEWRVGHIYETSDGEFQHIGIPVPEDDTYLIVIVNKPNKTIMGHHVLNLGAMYSSESANGT